MRQQPTFHAMHFKFQLSAPASPLFTSRGPNRSLHPVSSLCGAAFLCLHFFPPLYFCFSFVCLLLISAPPHQARSAAMMSFFSIYHSQSFMSLEQKWKQRLGPETRGCLNWVVQHILIKLLVQLDFTGTRTMGGYRLGQV